MSLECSKKIFLNLIKNLESKDKVYFLNWIADEWKLGDPNSSSPADEDLLLIEIAAEIRNKVPTSGILQSEIIYEPIHTSKDEREKTMHVDEFLYDDDFMDKLVEEGKISRHYCADCGSKNSRPLTLISHSCSVERMRYIFTVLLPPLDGQMFLDIGSRFGAVLFGAHVLSSAKRIVGVEINGDLCSLARSVLDQRSMLDRVEVIQADIVSQENLVSEADVILINNVFEYFSDSGKAVKCWRMLFKNIKPGATLVLMPRAEATFKLYNFGVPWSDWLTELPLYDPSALGIEDWEGLQESMAAYQVKNPEPQPQ